MKCEFCGRKIESFKITQNYIELFNIVGFNSERIPECDNPLYDLAILMADNSKNQRLLEYITEREINCSIFESVTCSHCESKEFWMYHNYLVYYSFESVILNKAKEYLKDKAPEYTDLFEHFSNTEAYLRIIQKLDAPEYNKLIDIREFSYNFHPPIGGPPPDDWVTPILTAIGINIFSAIMYDYFKSNFKLSKPYIYARRKYLLYKEMKRLQKLSKFSFPYLQITLDPKLEYILSLIPEKEAKKIIKKIADEHAKEYCKTMYHYIKNIKK